MIARIPALLLLFVASMLLAVGCGGDDSSSSDDGAAEDTTEEPAAEDTETESNDEASAPPAEGGLELGVVGNELKFDTTELTAPAGSVTLTLNNTSSIQHNIAIENADGEELAAGELVGDGESSTITVDLEPGTYTYFCSPHKSSGMTGTLTVT
jgi:plastocyanin